jgi:prolyl-tRNA synthetase
MIPTGKLEEPFVIRPTSETIIGAAFARWVQSYRDLPLLINQWANVMRWEMRPRLFLRTAEFLWQEGHTAHETADEAIEETRLMHRVYVDFLRNHLAIPVIPGEKTENERFPGAVNTYTVEAMVQDRKAIQAGTSHYLGQNFAKAANIQFLGRDNTKQLAHTTSWGVSTRLIGTLIMAHGDDDGIILPPRVAPNQIVILPITPKPDTRQEVIDACEALATTLRTQSFCGEPLRVHVDKRDLQGGAKNWEWIKKGVPLRLEMGPRDITSRSVAVCRRDQGPKAKEIMSKEDLIRGVTELLHEIQDALLKRATELRDSNMKKMDSLDEFKAFFAEGAHSGFALMHWAGSNEEEEQIAKDMKVTIRCIPLGDEYAEEGKCFITGKPSHRRVVFARSY